MKNTAFLFFIAFFCIGEGCTRAETTYSFTYNAKTYSIVKEKKSWTSAAKQAVEMDGYLAEINDAAEQAAIYDAIINGAAISSTYTSVSDGGGVAYVWIGANDIAAEGIWLWDGDHDDMGTNFWNGQGAAGKGDGSLVVGEYVNWGGTSTDKYQEPDNYGDSQDCAAIGLAGWPSGSGALGIAGEWNDINIDNALYFVVEKDPND